MGCNVPSLTDFLIILLISSFCLLAGCNILDFVVIKTKNFLFLFQDLAASIDEEDVDRFTNAIKEFDSMTRLVCFLILL